MSLFDGGGVWRGGDRYPTRPQRRVRMGHPEFLSVALGCCEQEAGGCGEDYRGDGHGEVSGCLAEGLCLLMCGIEIHVGLLRVRLRGSLTHS